MNIIRGFGSLAAIVLQAMSLMAQAPAHGVREFTESGSFEVPAGVTTLEVELGGGGGGAAAAGLGSGGGGGGGAAGAEASVPVETARTAVAA